MTKQTIFDSELNNGEELLWWARPGLAAFVLAHMRAVLMGLPFIGFAWVWHGWVMKSGALPALGAVTWLSLAVGLMYCAFPVAAYVRGSWFTFYGLTKSRLLILTLYPRRKCESYLLKDLNQMVVRTESGRSGSLLFSAPGMKKAGAIRPHTGFYGIPRVADVEDAIRTLRDPEAALAKQATQSQAQSQAQAHTASARAGVPHPDTQRFTPSSHSEAVRAEV